MRALIDTSVWIDYFKGGTHSTLLDSLLDDDNIVTNNIILAELVPLLTIKKQYKIISLLNNVTLLPLQINWPEIIRWQTLCLSKGHNGIGIPDLIIAQNAVHQDCMLFSLDKHFRLLNQVTNELQLLA